MSREDQNKGFLIFDVATNLILFLVLLFAMKTIERGAHQFIWWMIAVVSVIVAIKIVKGVFGVLHNVTSVVAKVIKIAVIVILVALIVYFLVSFF